MGSLLDLWAGLETQVHHGLTDRWHVNFFNSTFMSLACAVLRLGHYIELRQLETGAKVRL